MRVCCRFLILVLCALPSIGAAPEVAKVEPPNWWSGHSINPVRLLVRGKGLKGASVSWARGKTGNVKVNETGTYLFVDVTIPRRLAAGSYPLKIKTAEGEAAAPFRIEAALARNGRFQGFNSDDLIYLIMPDRFANGDPSNDDPPQSPGLLDRAKGRFYHGGDLDGIIRKLPYLRSLGVTAVWLNPVYDNVNHLNRRETYDNLPITDYHGYGAVDFYAVDEHFGDLAKFRELVDAAHAAGIKVIQDQVANHTGPYHPWVEDSPTPTWYHGTRPSHLSNTWQTWTLMDPYSPLSMRKATLEGWFINILPDLNQGDPEVARYLIQNTLWWIGVSGLDGIRQDTLPYVPRQFWSDWMRSITREYPSFNVVGELFDGDPSLVSYFQGGRRQADGIDTGIDTLFDFPGFFPLRRAFAQGLNLRELGVMLGRDHLYANPNRLVTFLGLHDVARFMSEPGATPAGLKLAFTFLLTTRGIPMIYYGDEIGMPGGNDPDNRRDFPGGFPGDARDAFSESGRTPDEQQIYSHVQKLANLRRELPALRRGTLLHLALSDQAYVYARKFEGKAVLIAINNGKSTAAIHADVTAAGLPADTELADQLEAAAAARISANQLEVSLPPRSAAILTARPVR